MKYTKIIEVDFYICDERDIDDLEGYTVVCKQPAIKLYQTNKDYQQFHYCEEHSPRNFYSQSTYLGELK